MTMSSKVGHVHSGDNNLFTNIASVGTWFVGRFTIWCQTSSLWIIAEVLWLV